MDMRDQFRPEILDLFWRFVYERQAIWHRRVIERREAPWTDDQVLQKHRFTNVYREMDRGTIYVVENVLEQHESRADRIFNTMIYRLICCIPTYDAIGFQRLETFEESRLLEKFQELYDSGASLFGTAYIVSPYFRLGSHFKHENVAKLFGLLHQNFSSFLEELDSATKLDVAFRVIEDQYGYGPFLAFQVCVDLLYPLRTEGGKGLLPYSHNDWARLGPGARRGLARIYRGDYKRGLPALRWLQQNQHDEFARLGLEFSYLLDNQANRIPISLANLQNCLCEFHKYASTREGTGRAQRLFPKGGYSHE